MKYYKRLHLYSKNPQSNRLVVEADNQIVTDSTVSLLLPKGTNLQRPPTFIDGQVRYNTSINEYEVYNSTGNGTGWELIRTVRPAPITVQTVGIGDYITTSFGPLLYSTGENYTNYQLPQNIFVFVENVYQLPNVNYTLVQGTGDDVFIEFLSPPPNKSVTAILGFDGYFPPFNT